MKDEPAFPQSIDPSGVCGGLTKREWFAGMAPPVPDGFGDGEYPKDDTDEAVDEWFVRRAVAWSQRYADAM